MVYISQKLKRVIEEDFNYECFSINGGAGLAAKASIGGAIGNSLVISKC